ncbi:MAG: phosphoribosylglycinamide formyltransferase [Rhodospirillaceae bacterium]|nr:MAG: phosphoribosylglycinamide formyltransferase [Rhodospirillaceae bacterium]
MARFPARPSLAFLASHNGTNMRAIVAACKQAQIRAQAVLLISNNGDSAAMAWAKANKIPASHISATTAGSDAEADATIASTLSMAGADLVILAGYMRKLGPETLGVFKRRILNVHPALLPKFGGQGMYGKRVHEAVLASGDKETGVTIHLVDDVYDHGPIVAQDRVPVQPGDTPETLAARVQAREQTLYVETLKRIFTGEIDLDKI